jgi:ribonuclease HI
MISIYSDGSASFKQANGGWAFVAIKGGDQAELYGFAENTTISVMELLPIRNALEWIPIGPLPIRLFCDSQYAVNALNVWGPEWLAMGGKNAAGQPPKHWKLIKETLLLIATHREQRAVTVVWIPGHRKLPNNERADFLAGYARKNKQTNWSPPAAE